MAEEGTAGNTQSTGAADAAASATTQAAAPAAAQGDSTTTQQATEGQTPAAGTEPAEGAATKVDGGKPQGAPEKYEFKATEGTTFNEAVLGAYSEVAKELNLPQEAAQKILDKVSPVLAAQQTEAIQQAQAAWIDATKSDKEFGGEKLTENVAVAKKAIDAFGTPALTKLLNDTGLGNHPELIRVFYRAGKAISEARFVAGSASAKGGIQNQADALYPTQQK